MRDKVEIRLGRSPRSRLQDSRSGRLEETVTVAARHAAARDAQRIGRTGHRREAHRADAALGRQPVRARAPRARRRLSRRPEVLAAVRQRRHLRLHRRRRDRAATSSRSTARPNMANGRRVAFVPPAGAVQEFKVETATFDAQQGHTAGATVNVTLKSGTNKFKGDGYYHYRDEKLVGERLLPRARRPAQGAASTTSATASRSAARCSSASCTTAATRRSSSPAASGSTTSSRSPASSRCRPRRSATATSRRCSRRASVIYDPLTAVRRADGRIERQPFPGNIIPAQPHQPDRARISEVLPAAEPGRQRAGPNNYFSSNPRGDDFYSMNYRVDHVLDRQAALLRPLLAQQPRREPRQLDRRGRTASRRPATSSSASTTPSTSTTSGRCRRHRC